MVCLLLLQLPSPLLLAGRVATILPLTSLAHTPTGTLALCFSVERRETLETWAHKDPLELATALVTVATQTLRLALPTAL
jgi:hypothetical protein